MTNNRKATLHRIIGWTIIGVSCIAASLVGSARDHPAEPAAAASTIQHVVLILEENHAQSQSQPGMPYLTGLGQTYAHTTALSAITHPSLPNYFALTSGSTQGKSSDCGSGTSGCTTGADNIYHQSAPLWSQWSESMPKPCDHVNARPYVVHHAPAPFYTDLNATCAQRDVAFTKTAPPPITSGFTFLTPNLNDNAHDGSLAAADAWLKTVVPKLMADPAYVDGSTLIEVTFDEGSGSNQTVQTVFVNPALSGRTVTLRANHYSILRLNEELLGYPLLGGARSAVDIRSQLGL